MPQLLDDHIFRPDMRYEAHRLVITVPDEETYCEHKGESSWAVNNGWKAQLLKHVSPAMKTKLIKLKRQLLG